MAVCGELIALVETNKVSLPKAEEAEQEFEATELCGELRTPAETGKTSVPKAEGPLQLEV
jgi:hypothetical protein